MLAAARAMDGGTSSVYLIMMKLVSLLLRLVTTVVDAATPVDWVTINVRETVHDIVLAWCPSFFCSSLYPIKRGGGRRWQSARSFRLNLRQFTVRRLQVRLFYLIRFFSRWKFRCEQASHLLKKGIGNSCSNNCYNNCTKGTKPRTAAMLESGSSSGRSRSSYYDSSNSFYSELAIRECLEFIKMSTSSSLSSDHQEAIDR
ncbi:hypothetical protein RHMOL_Rhmol06G0010100 [Rhododendron molle]|uniref:Uncharacterized protein n=1 Tax=Rhododendron molle TaxID=49168 RepID=A0ACC0N8L5_RHOML|nr:hypothetical protein RHMOL_Rhmol06G0010100 [Rhododendron molle]